MSGATDLGRLESAAMALHQRQCRADAVIVQGAAAELEALRERLHRVEAVVEEFFDPEPYRSAGKPTRANNAFYEIADIVKPEGGGR